MAAIRERQAITAGQGPPGQLEVAYAINAAWNAPTYVCHPEPCLDVVSLGLVDGVRAEADAIVVELALAGPASQG
jgi:hypothetical protein